MAPVLREIAIGMGANMCAASYSLLMVLSRITAQLAVFVTTSTLRPCLAWLFIGAAMMIGVAKKIGMKPT